MRNTAISASLLLAACNSQMLQRVSKTQENRNHDVNENSFRYPSAPNPSYEYYCPYPEPNMPGSGYKNITERTESAAYVIYAKAIEKKITKTTLYGQEYDVLWSLECAPLRQPRGAVVPQEFWMSGLGRFGPNYIPCGPRNVVTGFNYVFYGANWDSKTNHMELSEINNQEGLFRVETDAAARKELAPWLNECIANFCHDDTDANTEDWQPMSLEQRIFDAEYAFEVHMSSDNVGCVQCVLNQPENESWIEHKYSVNETLMVQDAGSCHEYTGVAGKRYIALLQRVNLNGVILPDGQLMPDEVNGQVALVEWDNQVQSELASVLVNCPAVDYQCPAENEPVTEVPEPSSSEKFGVFVGLVVAAFLF